MDARCLIEAELKARSDYSAPGRRYHDQRHLDECLRELDFVEWLEEHDRRLLGWALLWHDAVYDPQRSDNEERSADLAKRELLECGVSEEDASEVERLILLTKDHRVGEGDRLGALIVSIDLAILGADPQRYRDYADAVRLEYAHLSGEEWRAGRAALLEQLLAADRLYPDQEFRGRLEKQARRNIEAELRMLREG